MHWIRALLWIAASMFLATCGYYSLLASAARSWPETTGAVTSSYVRVFGAGLPAEGGDPDRHVHILRYEYSVDGRRFVGSDRGLADGTFLLPQAASRQAAELPR